MIIVKSFSLVGDRVSDFSALCDKNTIAVVRPEKALEDLLRGIIRRTVAEKRPIGNDFQQVEDYFCGLSANPAYRAKVDQTVTMLETYLSEGMYIQADVQAIADYVMARTARLCAEAVAAEAGGLTVIDGTQLVVCREDAPKPYFDWDASRSEIAARCSHGGIVVAGGYGRLGSGYVVRIGRGGSHMMASLIASAVAAEGIEFFSSLADFFAGKGGITYDEAAHYCANPASPIPSAALWPAKKAGIPIAVKNIGAPDKVYALISDRSSRDGSDSPIADLVAEKGLDLITVLGTGLLGTVGLSSSIFSALAAEGVNVRFISQSSSEYSISFAVRREESERVVAALQALVSDNKLMELDDVMVLNQHVGIVTIFGSRMKNVPGVSGHVFSALGKGGINIIASAQGGEELSISVVVEEADLEKAAALLR